MPSLSTTQFSIGPIIKIFGAKEGLFYRSVDLRNVCSKKLGCKLKLWRQDISRASRFPIVLFWPRKTIVHNMSLLTWLNISQAKLLYEILQIRFNGRRFAPLYYTNHHLTLRNYTETRYPTNLCLKMVFEQLLS